MQCLSVGAKGSRLPTTTVPILRSAACLHCWVPFVVLPSCAEHISSQHITSQHVTTCKTKKYMCLDEGSYIS
eukprot:1162233-Amphidinium_carterae.1